MADGSESPVYWAKVAAVTFGVWALAIPVGVGMMKSSLNDMAVVQQRMEERQTAQILLTEKRLVLLEDRQLNVISKISAQDKELEQLTREVFRHSAANGNSKGK